MAARRPHTDLLARLPDSGFTPSVRDVPALAELLADENAEVARDAERALARVGHLSWDGSSRPRRVPGRPCGQAWRVFWGAWRAKRGQCLGWWKRSRTRTRACGVRRRGRSGSSEGGRAGAAALRTGERVPAAERALRRARPERGDGAAGDCGGAGERSERGWRSSGWARCGPTSPSSPASPGRPG